jgi:hypothetical protein
MRILPHSLFLGILSGEISFERTHTTRAEARDKLVKMTNRDFGYDVRAWKAFIKSHLKYIYKPLQSLTMNDRYVGDKRRDDAVNLLDALKDFAPVMAMAGIDYPDKSKERQRALNALQKWTSQDFGYDITAWEKWFEVNLKTLPERPRRSRKK